MPRAEVLDSISSYHGTDSSSHATFASPGRNRGPLFSRCGKSREQTPLTSGTVSSTGDLSPSLPLLGGYFHCPFSTSAKPVLLPGASLAQGKLKKQRQSAAAWNHDKPAGNSGRKGDLSFAGHAPGSDGRRYPAAKAIKLFPNR